VIIVFVIFAEKREVIFSLSGVMNPEDGGIISEPAFIQNFIVLIATIKLWS
jgi:hypothetical protein